MARATVGMDETGYATRSSHEELRYFSPDAWMATEMKDARTADDVSEIPLGELDADIGGTHRSRDPSN